MGGDSEVAGRSGQEATGGEEGGGGTTGADQEEVEGLVSIGVMGREGEGEGRGRGRGRVGGESGVIEEGDGVGGERRRLKCVEWVVECVDRGENGGVSIVWMMECVVYERGIKAA